MRTSVRSFVLAVAFVAAHLSFGLVGIASAATISPAIGASSDDVALQADGKIVVVGPCNRPRLSPVCFPEYIVARYEPDGSLDSSFGTKGRVPAGQAPNFPLMPTAVAIDGAGRIVVAGSIADSASIYSPPDFGIARYLPNGALDPSFGEGGVVRTNLDPNEQAGDDARGVVITPDMKIFVGGSSFGGGLYHPAVARYNSDGSLDNSFSGDGRLIVDDIVGFAEAMTVDSHGRVMIAESNGLTRLTPDGALDVTLAGSGHLMLPSKRDMRVSSILEDPAGRILVAASFLPCRLCTTSTMLTRITASGSLDASFGASQSGSIEIASTSAISAALQADGKIVMTGVDTKRRFFGAAKFARFDQQGHPDPTFNGTGFVRRAVAGRPTTPLGSFLLPHGKLLSIADVSGRCQWDGSGWLEPLCSVKAVLRTKSNGKVDTSLGGVGFVTNPLIHYCPFSPYRSCGIDLTSKQLKALMRTSLSKRIRLGHGKVTTPVRCPKRVETSCLITVSIFARGTHHHLTLPRTGRVSAGKSRKISLRIRPRLLTRLEQNQRIILFERVEANDKRVVVAELRRLSQQAGPVRWPVRQSAGLR